MTIHIENLAFSYKKESIYQSFNADINHAGIYGLFGRNGSGKSTLLKLLSGLITPKGGEIKVLGYLPRQRLPNFLSQIYILPEEFHLPDLSPDILGKTHHHFYPKFDLEHFANYLEKLEIPSDKRFSQMSLGQKKKSAIAFALATHTPVLLMDEPTNGLDIVSREQFKDLMASPEQSDRIVLISTHQAHDLERIINHIWFIDGGQLLLSSTIDTLGKQLTMGFSDTDSLPDNVIYQETIGQQTAWIAPNTSGTSNKLNMEMLYKALSLNKTDIINAISGEK
ncbi:MAG: ABC transporter ATP-binding protein [Gammaproteobacteria bacterium]|nr:ABC transporter ATP-binding protein [Gammaproteobacteria bacterium]